MLRVTQVGMSFNSCDDSTALSGARQLRGENHSYRSHCSIFFLRLSVTALLSHLGEPDL